MVFGHGPSCNKTLAFSGRGKPLIYGYIRTSRAAVDGLASMHPETQLRGDTLTVTALDRVSRNRVEEVVCQNHVM